MKYSLWPVVLKLQLSGENDSAGTAGAGFFGAGASVTTVFFDFFFFFGPANETAAAKTIRRENIKNVFIMVVQYCWPTSKALALSC